MMIPTIKPSTMVTPSGVYVDVTDVQTIRMDAGYVYAPYIPQTVQSGHSRQTFLEQIQLKQRLNDLGEKNLSRFCFHNGYWLNKDGRIDTIANMKNDHLNNAYNYINKYGKRSIWGLGERWKPILLTEMKKRGIR